MERDWNLYFAAKAASDEFFAAVTYHYGHPKRIWGIARHDLPQPIRDALAKKTRAYRRWFQHCEACARAGE